MAEESLQYSPDSEQSYSVTPPHHQEESEDESSFVSHTQHLVQVMEERIKQVGTEQLNVVKIIFKINELSTNFTEGLSFH